MASYEISGIKGTKDYMFAFKSLHQEADRNRNNINGFVMKRQIKLDGYDRKRGVLTVFIEEEIDSFQLREILSNIPYAPERGLELKILKD
jgi:hypothetical protein